MRNHRSFLPALVLSLFLAACTTSSGQPTAPPTEEQPPPPAPTAESHPQATESGAALSPQPVKPTPRQELTATDPSSVQLASGKVQVLEFFAFW